MKGTAQDNDIDKIHDDIYRAFRDGTKHQAMRKLEKKILENPEMSWDTICNIFDNYRGDIDGLRKWCDDIRAEDCISLNNAYPYLRFEERTQFFPFSSDQSYDEAKRKLSDCIIESDDGERTMTIRMVKIVSVNRDVLINSGKSKDRYNFGSFREYKNYGLIGTGATGSVYKTIRDGDVYAMKIPRNADYNSNVPFKVDEKDIASFEKEARNWEFLSNVCPDAVVCLIDCGISPFPWMAIEYGECDFRTAIDNGDVKIDDFIDLLKKLKKLHDNKIIHCDIKPENIMKVNGKWKFTDFGLSRNIATITHSNGGIAGTPFYMAPEQVSPGKYGSVDVTTDLWQMGILLYQILTKSPPYGSNDMNVIYAQILTDGPDLSNVPEEYRSVLEKAFEKDRKKRYQGASEFINAMGGPKFGVRKKLFGRTSDKKEVNKEKPVISDDITRIKDMKSKGSSLSDLKRAGFKPKDLREAGFTLNEFMKVCSGEEILAAGFAASELKSKGYTARMLYKAGYSAKDLHDAGFSLGEVKETVLHEDELKDAGYGLKEFKAIGENVYTLKGWGFTLYELKEAGYPLDELMDDFEFNDLIAVGFSLIDFKKAGYSADDLYDKGYTVAQLKAAGYTAEEMVEANFDLEDLRAARYTAKELYNAGCSARHLNEAGFSARELRAAGINSTYDIEDAGYSESEIKWSVFTGKNIFLLAILIGTFCLSAYSLWKWSYELIEFTDFRIVLVLVLILFLLVLPTCAEIWICYEDEDLKDSLLASILAFVPCLIFYLVEILFFQFGWLLISLPIYSIVFVFVCKNEITYGFMEMIHDVIQDILDM